MVLEALLEGHSPLLGELARAARDLILEVHPGAHQVVEEGWGGYLLFQQVAEAGSTVCWLSVHQRHLSLGFSQAQNLQDRAGLLQGKGKFSRHIKLKSRADLARPEVRDLLEQAWRGQPEPAFLVGALQHIRNKCLSWPQVSEKRSHGHPTFFVGKPSFAVYGIYAPALAFKPEPGWALELSGDERFYPTPYLGSQGWWSLDLHSGVDWAEVDDLLERSYRYVGASGRTKNQRK
jgi:predicted DNA-binding protein (MmcQ/YjbR family)